MLIRRVQKSDNLSLATIIRQTFVEHDAPKHGTVYSDTTTDNLFSLFETENAVLWVGELNGEVVGCCGIYPTQGLPTHCAELVKFYISTKARGQGLGKMLMEQSVKSAKELGYTQLYLESLPQFSNAVNIYEKQGFVKLQQPLGQSGHIACNIYMLKTLS